MVNQIIQLLSSLVLAMRTFVKPVVLLPDPFVLHSTAVPYFRMTGGQYLGEGNLEYLTEAGWYPVCDIPVDYPELLCGLFGFVLVLIQT